MKQLDEKIFLGTKLREALVYYCTGNDLTGDLPIKKKLEFIPKLLRNNIVEFIDCKTRKIHKLEAKLQKMKENTETKMTENNLSLHEIKNLGGKV